MLKPKDKTVTKDCWISLIIDESGSMKKQQRIVIDGVNEFIQDRKKEAKDGINNKIWVTTFSGSSRSALSNIEVAKVGELTEEDYTPNGSTALFDAVGTNLIELLYEFEKVKDKPRVTVAIMTDGEENSSKIFKQEGIKQLIYRAESTGMFTVTYLGANQDAWRAASGMGIGTKNTAGFKINCTASALRGLSVAQNTFSGQRVNSSRNYFQDNTNVEDLDKKES